MKHSFFRLLLFTFIGIYACTNQRISPIEPVSFAQSGDSATISVAEAKQWFDGRQVAKAAGRVGTTQNENTFRLEKVLNWSKAKNRKSNKKRDWVVVPLQAEARQQVGYLWSTPTATLESQRGWASYTYQAFFKNGRGEIQTYIFKVLPSLENIRQNQENTGQNQFNGIILGFDENGNFIEGAKYENGKISGATTNFSKGVSANGRVASCITYSVTIYWRICLEYQGQDVCTQGSDTYTSAFCDNPFNPVTEEVPGPEDGNYGGSGGGGTLTEAEIIANMVVLAPPKPISNMRDYLKCFDKKPGDTYKVTLYVDQPKGNSDIYINTDAAFGHKVGHAYLGLTQTGAYSLYVNRVLGWYPGQGGNPIYPTGPGVFGQDDGYSGGYDVSVTFSVTKDNFFKMIDYINGVSGNYDLNTFNCMDFSVQALQAAGISIPDNYTPWPRGGGSNPGKLGQDLRNMTLPPGATRQPSFGYPAQNTSNCN